MPDAVGERNPKSKLTKEQAMEIRSSVDTTKDLVARYGIGRTTIQRIRSGKYWSHVEPCDTHLPD